MLLVLLEILMLDIVHGHRLDHGVRVLMVAGMSRVKLLRPLIFARIEALCLCMLMHHIFVL